MAPRGILSDDAIAGLIEAGAVTLAAPLADNQIQPASLDLRLGDVAYRLRASFLPGPGRAVAERLSDDRLVMHEIDLTRGAVLETGCVYLAPLLESLKLPGDVHAAANPKSSTGRLDVFTRVIADGAASFDSAPAGYAGPLYAEISPRTFSVLARAGERLCQLRLRRGAHQPTRSVTVSVDLSGRFGAVAGFRGKRHAGVIDLADIGGHDPRDFWEPLSARGGGLVLDPGEFYILASKEHVRIGPEEAAEMAPIAPEIGEFRAHYAGFFDPGFGVEEAGGGQDARAVLEVRGRDVPFILEDGQAAAKLVYEPMAARPTALYGQSGSHYQAQTLKLSKHFKPWT